MTPPESPKFRDPCAGFTLIEALVALAVLALLLVVLSGGFQLVMRQSDLQAGASALRSAAAGREALVRRLAAAVPVEFSQGDSDATARGLAGSSDAVEFVTMAPLSIGGLLIQKLTVRATPSGRGDLLLVSRPYELKTKRRQPVEPTLFTVVMKDVTGLQLRYLGLAADGRGTIGWQSEWRAAHLPDLVEITIESTTGSSSGGIRRDLLVIAPLRARPRQQ